MSGILAGRVFYTFLPGGLKMTLAALADQANDDGGGIWAGQRLLAFKVGATDRAVRGHLKTLRDEGWIARDGRSPYGTDCYKIMVDKLPSSAECDEIRRLLRSGVAPEDISGRIDRKLFPPGNQLPVGPETSFR